jgi:predicted Zn-dependent protease
MSRTDPPAAAALDLDRVTALRLAGSAEHLTAALALVAQHPSEVRACIEAAYALDRTGDEHAAVQHYDAAWHLGVPTDARRRFVVGYGSTLRNVGRSEQAIALLTEELARDPGYPAFAAFLALALHSAGHASAALATMLGCLLEIAERSPPTLPPANPLDGYQRALGEYYRELVDQSFADQDPAQRLK